MLRVPKPPTGGDAEMARLELFSEQLDEAVSLARSDRISRQRLSLLVLDHLAEVLISDHAEACFSASDDAGWLALETYSSEERREILYKFNRRVALAQREFAGTGSFYYPGPILGDTDAAIFKVAHKYRNRLYHAGTQSEAVLQPLCFLYAQAISRTFIGSVPSVIWGGGRAFVDSFPILSRYGFAGPSETSFAPRSAAEWIMEQITGDLDVTSAVLRQTLADDVSARCEQVADELRELAKEGLTGPGLQHMLRAAELWAAHRGDEVLIRLQDRRREIVHRVTTTRERVERAQLRKEWADVEDAEDQRKAELELNFKFAFEEGTVEGFSDEARSLGASRAGVRGLLERYQRIDSRLTEFEWSVQWIRRSWDRETDRIEEEAVEAARRKFGVKSPGDPGEGMVPATT
jgi:hypothetical protein